MRRAERLFRLVRELRSRNVSRAEDLAAAFEISVRTVYRDIAHLQASGLPIEGEAGVGYILRPGFDLPAMTFTFEQIDALAVGLSFVEAAGDASLSLAAKEVRAKLQAALPEPDQRKLEQAPFFASRREGPADPKLRTIRRRSARRASCALAIPMPMALSLIAVSVRSPSGPSPTDGCLLPGANCGATFAPSGLIGFP